MSVSLPKSMMYGSLPVAPPSTTRTLSLEPTSGSQNYTGGGSRVIFTLPGGMRSSFIRPGSMRLQFKVSNNFDANGAWDNSAGCVSAIRNADLYVGGNLVSSIQSYGAHAQSVVDTHYSLEENKAGNMLSGATATRQPTATLTAGSSGQFFETQLYDPVFGMTQRLAYPMSAQNTKLEFELEADAQAVFGASITTGSLTYSQFKLRFEVVTLEESVASMLAQAHAGVYILPLDWIRTHTQILANPSNSIQQTLLPIRASSIKRVVTTHRDNANQNLISKASITERFNPAGNAVEDGLDQQLRIGVTYVPQDSNKIFTNIVSATQKAVLKQDLMCLANKATFLAEANGTEGSWIWAQGCGQLSGDGMTEEGLSSISSDLVVQNKYGGVPASVVEFYSVYADAVLNIMDSGDSSIIV